MCSMIKTITLLFIFWPIFLLSQFAPAANVSGTTAIHKDSSIIVSWATVVVDFQRGYEDVAAPAAYASFGDSTAALFMAEGNSTDVVSLGDAGVITLGFDFPIMNGAGPDLAVFENSFSHEYLEFAHVEVSSDGINYVRIPSTSLIENNTQTGPFADSNTEAVHNLAGKYIQGYGTPFDLEDIADSAGVNLDSVHYVRIIDVVGSIDSNYGSFDHLGNLINDPYPTAFEAGGFDLDAVAVINENNIFASVANAALYNFKVYPNPATDEVQLTGYKGAVEIYDLNGKLMTNIISNGAAKVVLDEFPSGVYVIKAGEVFKRFVKL